MKAPRPDPSFEALLDYLKRTRGFDFSNYRRSTLLRRVQKRMGEVGTISFEDYQDYLEVHAEEFARLFDHALINVTSFFRDEEAWGFLALKSCRRSWRAIARFVCGARDAPRERRRSRWPWSLRKPWAKRNFANE